MKIDDLKRQAAHLEEAYDQMPPQDRLKLRPEVQRMIRSFAAQHEPVPLRLSRIGRSLDDEAYDDMFDNMPV